jgi:hypothetical protein
VPPWASLNVSAAGGRHACVDLRRVLSFATISVCLAITRHRYMATGLMIHGLCFRKSRAFANHKPILRTPVGWLKYGSDAALPRRPSALQHRTWHACVCQVDGSAAGCPAELCVLLRPQLDAESPKRQPRTPCPTPYPKHNTQGRARWQFAPSRPETQT